jgi:hypothetical protein
MFKSQPLLILKAHTLSSTYVYYKSIYMYIVTVCNLHILIPSSVDVSKVSTLPRVRLKKSSKTNSRARHVPENSIHKHHPTTY